MKKNGENYKRRYLNPGSIAEEDSGEIKRGSKPAEDLSAIMNKLVGESEYSKKLNQYNIFNHWPAIVGPAIGKKTKPEKLFKGLLYISVSNSTWSNELSSMSDQLIKKINEYIGEEIVKGLRFKIQI
jgi:predicted nucleic acid-binding Zn ribbon protein